ERAAGFLDLGRRREIALRHVAARALEARAGFVRAAGLLLGRGAAPHPALPLAAPPPRGRRPRRAGGGPPGPLRFEAAVTADGGLDRVLGAGRVAVDAAQALRPFAP